jgi:hypothetical protein
LIPAQLDLQAVDPNVALSSFDWNINQPPKPATPRSVRIVEFLGAMAIRQSLATWCRAIRF